MSKNILSIILGTVLILLKFWSKSNFFIYISIWAYWGFLRARKDVLTLYRGYTIRVIILIIRVLINYIKFWFFILEGIVPRTLLRTPLGVSPGIPGDFSLITPYRFSEIRLSGWGSVSDSTGGQLLDPRGVFLDPFFYV